jgi:DNA-binding MarR family transcriptional regulator
MEIQNILGYLLNASARLTKRKMDRELEMYHLTTSQWAILKLLDTKHELTQAQIADELLGDRSTAGTVIFKLIDKGYLAKSLDTNDRRAYVVKMTQKAEGIIQHIETKAEEISSQALKGLSEEEIAVLYHSLNQIITNLSEGE